MFKKERISLTQHHRDYLASSDWLDRKRTLLAKGEIDIQQEGSELLVHGFAGPVKEATDVIHELLKGKCFTIGKCENHCAKKATIHQVTTMLATSKNVLFPGPNHLLTTGSEDPTLRLSPKRQRVKGHQYW